MCTTSNPRCFICTMPAPGIRNESSRILMNNLTAKDSQKLRDIIALDETIGQQGTWKFDTD